MSSNTEEQGKSSSYHDGHFGWDGDDGTPEWALTEAALELEGAIEDLGKIAFRVILGRGLRAKFDTVDGTSDVEFDEYDLMKSGDLCLEHIGKAIIELRDVLADLPALDVVSEGVE